VVTNALAPAGSGSYSYIGTLPGLTRTWDLGPHEVQVFAGAPSPTLPTSGAVATAVLCIEEQGSGSC
jgi:hypothetical protein